MRQLFIGLATLAWSAIAQAGAITTVPVAYAPGALPPVIVLSDVQVAFSPPLYVNDSVSINVSGATPDPLAAPVASCASPAGPPLTLGFLAATPSSWAFRVTSLPGAPAPPVCTFSGLAIVGSSLTQSCLAAVSFQAVASGSLQLIDSSPAPVPAALLVPCGPPTRVVSIDIRPGVTPNIISLNRDDPVAVAIFSTATFYAPSEIDSRSLTFGRTGTEASLRKCDSEARDVNGDGLLDLVCFFNVRALGFQPGDTQGVLMGLTLGGQQIKGTDSVVVSGFLCRGE